MIIAEEVRHALRNTTGLIARKATPQKTDNKLSDDVEIGIVILECVVIFGSFVVIAIFEYPLDDSLREGRIDNFQSSTAPVKTMDTDPSSEYFIVPCLEHTFIHSLDHKSERPTSVTADSSLPKPAPKKEELRRTRWLGKRHNSSAQRVQQANIS